MTSKSKTILEHLKDNTKIFGSLSSNLDGAEESLLSGKNTDKISLPPIMRAHFQESAVNTDYIKDFEDISLRARAKTLKLPACPPHKVSEAEFDFKAKHIVEAIKAAIKEHANKSNGHGAFEDGDGPVELKMVGVHIKGLIDLSKLDIPFSIRLIGCYIEGAILLDRSKIITLDVSGSVIDEGISAVYLSAKGAVRARRTLFRGPADFGAANIKGMCDFTDSILFPENNPPKITSYVGDRGILNFGMARLSQALRLERARIYGGVNMRGLKVGGMLFMNDAVLKCPLAHFEMMASSIVKEWHDKTNTTLKEDYISLSAQAALEADMDIAALLHKKLSNFHKPDLAFSLNLETIGGARKMQAIWDKPERALQFRLMQESHRASESALRAEGASFGGPIYAVGMRVSGRIRFKSMTCNGGISFDGSRFRTPRAIRSELKKLCKICSQDIIPKNAATNNQNTRNLTTLAKIFRDKYNDLKKRTKGQRNGFQREFALDFRGANIGGPLTFGRDKRAVQTDKNYDQKLQTHLVGDLSKIKVSLNQFCDIFGSDLKSKKAMREKLDEVFSKNSKKDNEKRKAKFKELNKALVELNVEEVNSEQETNITKLSKKFVELNDKKITSLQKYSFKQKYINSNKYKAGKKKLKDAIKLFHEIYNTRMAELIKTQDNKHDGFGKDQLTDVQKIQDCEILKDEQLTSTLIIGEIRLTNAVIKGSLSFRGMIANNFNSVEVPQDGPKKRRDVICMRNVTIEGDLDLRNSIGISSLNARQTIIDGSVRFCDKADDDPVGLQYEPVKNRAICPINLDVDGGFQFQRAKITGDAIFLFDKKHGPNIFGASARIGGKLQILPSRNDLHLNERQLEETFGQKSPENTSASLPHLNKWFLLQSIFSIFKRGSIVYEKYINKIINTIDKTAVPPPTINLENLTVPVFVHPPSAWPKPDGLIITGLKYESTKVIGPISPMWRSWPVVWSDLENNSKLQAPFVLISLIFGVLALTLLNYIHLTFDTMKDKLAWLDVINSPFKGILNTIDPYLEFFGKANVIALGVLMLCVAIILILSRSVHPTTKKERSLAVKWLRLQRRQLNTRQVLSEIRPSEPYIRAAKVLRASGLNKSADDVELERIRERARALSWRSSGPLKIIFIILDWFFGFGFKPAKGFMFAVCFGFISAGFFNMAEKKNVIVYANSPKMADVLSSEQQTPAIVHAHVPKVAPKFNSTLYAVDVFLPFIDLEIKENWKIDDAQRKGIFYSIMILFRFLGWGIIGLVILSLVARIETVLARSAVL